MFKYLFTATFLDGRTIEQPQDDRSVKHVEGAEWNPSAFTDVQDYENNSSPLGVFALKGNPDTDNREVYAVNLLTGEFFVNGTTFMLDQPLKELTDRQLIYFRTNRIDNVQQKPYIYAYNLGYKGKDEKGKIVEKVITIHG